MCTAIAYKNGESYFGRNLDLERGYGERVVVTPRNFPLKLRLEKPLTSHYAIIGMATVYKNFPLYYEGANEKGLGMAGLNFPNNAVYRPFDKEKINIVPFEFIPWVLGKCSCVDEAKTLLKNVNLVSASFSESLPLTPLHWMISDKQKSIVVESLKDGVRVQDNPFGVLTNNPPFDFHKINLNNFMHLHAKGAKNMFSDTFNFHNYSLGMGALGLPGDFSSASRFVKAFFVKENSVSKKNERENVNQFFHILSCVAMPKGCVWTSGGFEFTRYSSCINLNRGVYYFKTYQNQTVKSLNLTSVNLNDTHLFARKVSGLD